MACPNPSTERAFTPAAKDPRRSAQRIARRVASPIAAALLCALAHAAPAAAHPPAPSAPRELVRAQGRVGEAASGDKVVREVALVILGKEKRLFATDWRRFSLSDQPGVPPERERPRFEVRGTRDELARLGAARPDQQVTILAEQRPGSVDLFLLAVDLCPPR